MAIPSCRRRQGGWTSTRSSGPRSRGTRGKPPPDYADQAAQAPLRSRVMAAEPKSGQNLPPDDELIIGLVGPLGIDLDDLAQDLATVLDDFGYQTSYLRLSDAF